jgi:hypothetical protein
MDEMEFTEAESNMNDLVRPRGVHSDCASRGNSRALSDLHT